MFLPDLHPSFPYRTPLPRAPVLTHEGAVDGVPVEEVQLPLPRVGDAPDEHVLPRMQLHQLDAHDQLMCLAQPLVAHILRGGGGWVSGLQGGGGVEYPTQALKHTHLRTNTHTHTCAHRRALTFTFYLGMWAVRERGLIN